MSDPISREQAIDAIVELSDTIFKNIEKGATYPPRAWFAGMASAESIIEGLPSIDAVKHGIWIEENTRTRSSKFYCSVCHRTAYDPQPTRIAGWVKRCRYAYCPNCGAKMWE